MTVVTARGTAAIPIMPRRSRMRQPRRLPSRSRRTTCILVGTHPRSFDSRYIGVVDGQLLQFRVRPLWTWEAA